MNIKKIIVLFVVSLFAGLSSGFAQNSNILEIGSNAKTSTYVNLLTKDKSCSESTVLEWCISLGMNFYQSGYSIEIYDNNISLVNAFSDEYIYGTAVMAVVNLHYGFVQIEYSRWDEEKESIVGWDHLFFIKMSDGRILCVKFID